jgi:hypothetical protein
MVRAHQVTHRLDADVGHQQGVAGCDELLRAPLRCLRGAAAAAEQPDHHAGGCDLDQAVQPEANEGDRAGCDAGAERDRELDQMPAVPRPGCRRLRPLGSINAPSLAPGLGAAASAARNVGLAGFRIRSRARRHKDGQMRFDRAELLLADLTSPSVAHVVE